MSFYIDMTGVLNIFKTEVTFYQEKSGYDDFGRWQAEEETKKTVYEPFVPNNRQGLYSIVTALRETGKTSQYNAVWISAEVDS
ncbi:hypothetical protein [Ligilactobacillus equi]